MIIVEIGNNEASYSHGSWTSDSSGLARLLTSVSAAVDTFGYQPDREFFIVSEVLRILGKGKIIYHKQPEYEEGVIY